MTDPDLYSSDIPFAYENPEDYSDTESTYSKVEASDEGHGVEETLAITQILERNNIPCCIVGTSALKFYGAWRIRQFWEICVPTQLVSTAINLLLFDYAKCYRAFKRRRFYQPLSLVHYYPRLKTRGVDHFFCIFPSNDVHIFCHPSNITRSLRGLPYPKLDVFIQSCLETGDGVQLTDVIDGSNVSEDWGKKYLNLEGSSDLEWKNAKNRRAKMYGGRWADSLCTWHWNPSKKEFWLSLVRTKRSRLDWTSPEDIHATQYRLKGDPDPWTVVSKLA